MTVSFMQIYMHKIEIIICIRIFNESGYTSICIVNYKYHQIIIFEVQFVYFKSLHVLK